MKLLPSAAAAVFGARETVKAVIGKPAAVIQPVAYGRKLLAPELGFFFCAFAGVLDLHGRRADGYFDARQLRMHENHPVTPVFLALLFVLLAFVVM